MGFTDIRDGENAVHVWVENAAGEQRHDLGCEEAGGGHFFFQRTSAQDSSANLEALAHDVFSVKFIAATGDSAHKNHAALMGHRFLAGFDVGAADEIEQHIDSFASC